jgi:hypothetical protein
MSNPEEALITAATPSPATQPSTVGLEIALPTLVILGFIAFLVTGFGAGLGQIQPLPVYIFLGILLLLLQLYLSKDRSLLRTLYGLGAATFGLVYAAEASFFPAAPGNFTRKPITYVIINIIAVIVFIVDAVQRHQSSSSGQAGAPVKVRASASFYRNLATDFAGLAILFALSSLLLDSLNTRTVLHVFGVSQGSPYVGVDLNALFGISLPSNIHTLEGLNLALALVATVVWLLLVVILGAFAGSGVNANPGSTQGASQSAFGGFLAALGSIFSRGETQATYSLRSVLQIFIWLIPSFSITLVSQNVTSYLNKAATAQTGNTGSNILQLFNPLSTSSVNSFPTGLAVVGLTIVAFAAVVVAVALAEFNRQVIVDTLRELGTFIRVLSLTLVFFSLALAATNAVSILFNIDESTPFQVGALTIVALLAFGIYALIANTRRGVTVSPAGG